MSPTMLQTVLPILLVCVVLALRIRSMSRPQKLKSGRMMIAPAVLVVIGVFSLFANPLPPRGWLLCGVALIIGAAIGWQRGRMTKVWRDETTGELMQQASPAAMILLLAILAIRYFLRSYFGAVPDAQGHLTGNALMVTDAFLAFAIGLIAMTRIELLLRGRALTARD